MKPFGASFESVQLLRNGGDSLLIFQTRHGAISNCQLPITLKVIDNDQITNYFSQK